MERLVLTARVAYYQQPPQTESVLRGGLTSGRFVAWVDGLDVQAEGESADIAREELVQAMLIWISARDCTDSMAMALSEAGFPDVDEETELQLEFLDSQPVGRDAVYQQPSPSEKAGDNLPSNGLTEASGSTRREND